MSHSEKSITSIPKPAADFLKAVFPGKYIQGRGVLKGVPETIRAFGERGLILASPRILGNLKQDFGEEALRQAMVPEVFGGECCWPEIDRIAERVRQERLEVLVGMGGGKCIDTAKIVSDMAGIPVVVVPTIASTDAPCSGCAVVYTPGGEFESVYYQKMNPQVVLVDLDVLSKAPVRFLVSGMGDALSTWFEALACERTHSMNACGGYSTMAGLALAKLCYETLLRHGLAAKRDNQLGIVTPAFSHVVEANTLLSGIGFESSGLAAAHAIHNGLSALPATHAFYHGEKVAFGVLTGLHLSDADPARIREVFDFCIGLGLPVTLADIGLAGISESELMKAAVKACAPDESIHHEAGDMTPGMVLAAMRAADACGQEWKDLWKRS